MNSDSASNSNHRGRQRSIPRSVARSVYKSLGLKMRQTGLASHFDAIYSSHSFGLAKENPGFWAKLQAEELFDPRRTLLADDSLPVLRSARDYGIAHLLAIYQPDTKLPEKDVGEFPAIRRFGEVMPRQTQAA